MRKSNKSVSDERKYEVTLMTTEEKATESVREVFDSLGAKIEKENKMGKRPLAYVIKKHTELFYTNWVFTLLPSALSDLKNRLNSNENLVRYLILQVNS